MADRAPHRPAVAVLSAPSGASAELCVVADDRPGLLASISAVLAANRLGVLEAQRDNSRTRADGLDEAVDLFFVRAPGDGSLEDVRRSALKAERDLAAVLDGSLCPIGS